MLKKIELQRITGMNLNHKRLY